MAESPSACFPPVAGPSTRLLVLGSLPGVQSLARRQYYGHPRNHFWPLMGALTGRDDLPLLPYESRLQWLQTSGIGLWDVVASAVRPGSLDQNMTEIAANPLCDFVASLPGLRAIAFNGATAARIGTRQLQELPSVRSGAIPLLTLPSTSPANTIGYARKQTAWAERIAPILREADGMKA